MLLYVIRDKNGPETWSQQVVFPQHDDMVPTMGKSNQEPPSLISSISKRLKLAADGEDATGDMDEGTSPQRISPRISPTIGLSGGISGLAMGMMLPGMFFSASFGSKILNQICRSELIGMLCHTKLQSHLQSTNSPISSNIKICVKLSLTMLQVDQKAQFWAFILGQQRPIVE